MIHIKDLSQPQYRWACAVRGTRRASWTCTAMMSLPSALSSTPTCSSTRSRGWPAWRQSWARLMVSNQPSTWHKAFAWQALLFRLLPVNVIELNPLEPGEQLRGGGGGGAQHAQCQPPKLLLSQKQPNALPTKTPASAPTNWSTKHMTSWSIKILL